VTAEVDSSARLRETPEEQKALVQVTPEVAATAEPVAETEEEVTLMRDADEVDLPVQDRPQPILDSTATASQQEIEQTKPSGEPRLDEAGNAEMLPVPITENAAPALEADAAAPEGAEIPQLGEQAAAVVEELQDSEVPGLSESTQAQITVGTSESPANGEVVEPTQPTEAVNLEKSLSAEEPEPVAEPSAVPALGGSQYVAQVAATTEDPSPVVEAPISEPEAPASVPRPETSDVPANAEQATEATRSPVDETPGVDTPAVADERAANEEPAAAEDIFEAEKTVAREYVEAESAGVEASVGGEVAAVEQSMLPISKGPAASAKSHRSEKSNVTEEAGDDSLEAISQDPSSETATEAAAAETQVTEPDVDIVQAKAREAEPTPEPHGTQEAQALAHASAFGAEKVASETASEEYVLVEATSIPENAGPAVTEQSTALLQEAVDSGLPEPRNDSPVSNSAADNPAMASESFQLVEEPAFINQSTASLQQVSGPEQPSSQAETFATTIGDESIVMLSAEDSQLVDDSAVLVTEAELETREPAATMGEDPTIPILATSLGIGGLAAVVAVKSADAAESSVPVTGLASGGIQGETAPQLTSSSGAQSDASSRQAVSDGAETSVPVTDNAPVASIIDERTSGQVAVAVADYAVTHDASAAGFLDTRKTGKESPILGRTVYHEGSDYDPRDTNFSLQTETTYPLPTDTTFTLPTDTSFSLPSATKEALPETASGGDTVNSHSKEVAIGAGVAGTVGAATALVAHNFLDKPDLAPTVLDEFATDLDGATASETVSAKGISGERTEIERSLSREQGKAMETSQVVVDKSVPLSESFHVVDEDTPAREEEVESEKKKEASSEDGEESAARSAAVVGVGEAKTDKGYLVAPRPRTDGTGPAQQGDIMDFRVPTPGLVLPDLDDPVARQLSRMRSLRRQRRNTIKQAEEMVAAAVVIYATAEVLSPPGSPRIASPGTHVLGSPEMHSAAKGKGKEVEVPIMSLQDSAMPDEDEQDRGRARSRDPSDPVADLSVDDKEKIREPLKPEDSKVAHSSRRHSHHSSRHRSHRDSRDGSKDGSRRSHRSRSDSYTSVRSRGEDEPPRTPTREDPGFGEHKSSPHSRRHRTPEEQAAHDKRKEERRRARDLERAKDNAPDSLANTDKDGDRSAPRDRSERTSEHRHSHHRESRRHSQSRHSIDPKMDVVVPPSPAASKKFFDIKNGQSVLEPNFGGPRDTSASTAALPPTSSSSRTAVVPELRRSSTTRGSTTKMRRSEERSSSLRKDARDDEEAVPKPSREHRDRDRGTERARPTTAEQKVKASAAPVGVNAGNGDDVGGLSSSASGGDADSQAHRAKRQEKREREREREGKEKSGIRAAFKRFFTSST
jgi:hypothetical protein